MITLREIHSISLEDVRQKTTQYRLKLKEEFEKFYFGKERYKRQQNLQNSVDAEPYDIRQKLAIDFVNEYQKTLTQKELCLLMNSIKDTHEIQDVHLKICGLLRKKGYFKNVDPYNIMRTFSNLRESSKLQDRQKFLSIAYYGHLQ